MTKARTLADNFAADINGITAGTGITGGGTSGTVTVTNSMATAIDAKGDLVVGTGADTFSRLAVASTAGYLLSVDSAEATGLKWAAPAAGSALTYITGATFTTSSAISFPNNTFTATYDNYKIVFVLTSASANSQIRIRLRASGSDDSNATYYSGGTEVDSGGTETLTNVNNGTNFVWGTIKNANYIANFFDMTVYEPKVGSPTRISALGGVGGQGYAIVGGSFNANTSFDSMTIYPSTGTLTGNYRVYGLANS